jgi:predicted LPLAT superfamily acyltransferase
MTFKPLAVIPSRNHATALGEILARIERAGLPALVVDDGSDEPARLALAGFHHPERGIRVLRLEPNRGKGVAVMRGIEVAAEEGFSHVLQIDADGQHDLGALDALLGAARAAPEALVAGQAVFDASIPLGRRLGRWITHVWVWIETLSWRIKDSMCGFRVYPVAPTRALVARARIGERMDFDIDVMVRLFWQGVDVVQVPVRVVYPPGNPSNFDPLADNWRISKMHARLFFGMLARVPSLLARRAPDRAETEASAWWGLGERGAFLGLRFLAFVARVFGREICRAAAVPALLYFFLTGAERRRASLDYLDRVFRALGAGRRATWRDSWRHHMSFLDMAIDKFAAWTDPRRPPAVAAPADQPLERLAREGRGALVLVSHLGNIDVARAWAAGRRYPPMTVLVHTRHALRFNALLARLNPAFAQNLVQVTEIGPDTALALDERVRRGEWVFMAADRTPVSVDGRVVVVPFLGEAARFSQGPYVLGALLGCPVLLMFCLRDKGGYRIVVEDFADRIALPRGRRSEAVRDHAARYAARLEAYCLAAPFEWHNFYDFWHRGDGATPAAVSAQARSFEQSRGP